MMLFGLFRRSDRCCRQQQQSCIFVFVCMFYGPACFTVLWRMCVQYLGTGQVTVMADGQVGWGQQDGRPWEP